MSTLPFELDAEFLPDDYLVAPKWRAEGEASKASHTVLPKTLQKYQKKVAELQSKYSSPFASKRTPEPFMSQILIESQRKTRTNKLQLQPLQKSSSPSSSMNAIDNDANAHKILYRKKDLKPLPSRKARGGVIPRMPRRTLFDELVSPLASSAGTLTPGPCMLPYLEGFDAGLRDVPPLSRWHLIRGRDTVSRSDLQCTPLFAANCEGTAPKIKGGAFGIADRKLT